MTPDKNPKTLESVVNEELLKVYDWLNANKLTLNIKKVCYFPPSSKKAKLSNKY
jgi:hypothetical protein